MKKLKLYQQQQEQQFEKSDQNLFDRDKEHLGDLKKKQEELEGGELKKRVEANKRLEEGVGWLRTKTRKLRLRKEEMEARNRQQLIEIEKQKQLIEGLSNEQDYGQLVEEIQDDASILEDIGEELENIMFQIRRKASIYSKQLF